MRCLSLLLVLLLAACQPDSPTATEFAARVGDRYLQDEEVEAALGALPPGVDSLTARDQLIEQWVRSELLAQEAERVGLQSDPAVQRALIANERAVLAAALLDQLYEADLVTVPPAEVEAYFNQHADRFRLREPFVRARYLRVADRAAANEAQRALAPLGAEDDSLWTAVARTHAADTSLSLSLALRALPVSDLRDALGPVWDRFSDVRAGRMGPIVEADSAFHVMQIVRRYPVGTRAELAWVEPEVRRLLLISARKRDVARRVQQLKSEAEARSELEIRN